MIPEELWLEKFETLQKEHQILLDAVEEAIRDFKEIWNCTFEEPEKIPHWMLCRTNSVCRESADNALKKIHGAAKIVERSYEE